MYLYDLTKLKHEISAHNNERMNHSDFALIKLNLIGNSRFFENNLVKHEDHSNIFNDAETIKKDFVD